MKLINCKPAKITVLMGLLLFVIIFSACCKPPARGTLEYAVINADIIAQGIITKSEYKELKESVVRDNTIFTLSISKVIKGNPKTKNILIKVKEGSLPNGLTGEFQDSSDHGYVLQDEVLDCFQYLDADYYYGIPGGEWMKSDQQYISKKTTIEEHLGKILKIMYANDLPISLPKSEWPPYPTGPFLFPWQK
jgi:hypothetical protein